MKATLLSILIALGIVFLPYKDSHFVLDSLYYVFIGISSFFLILLPFTFGLSLTPLQKVEQNITPRLFEMFLRDKKIQIYGTLICLFPLLTIALFILPPFVTDKRYLFAIWIILFGIALDLYQNLLFRILNYLDPFKMMKLFTADAKESIKTDKLDNLIGSIDSLSEVSLRAIERSNMSLAEQSIRELRDIGVSFLKGAKNLTNLDQELSNFEKSHIDRVGYTLLYLLNRYEMINEKGIHKKFQPLVTLCLNCVGRQAIASAAYDISLTTYSINSIGKMSQLALEHGLKEAAIKSQILQVEVAKSIIKENDLTYLEIKTPFMALIDNLENLSKGLFKLDKSTHMNLLTQPFIELKEIFTHPPIETHQDTPAILSEINRVIDEFKSLELVLNTMPNPREIIAEGQP